LPGKCRRTSHFTIAGFFFLVPPLLNALLEMGADRILFSVDDPFMTNQEVRAFSNRCGVSAADWEKIVHGNAERLLKL
jgi:predicted TIM-barrel fold metal-dependent hydrolase